MLERVPGQGSGGSLLLSDEVARSSPRAGKQSSPELPLSPPSLCASTKPTVHSLCGLIEAQSHQRAHDWSLQEGTGAFSEPTAATLERGSEAALRPWGSPLSSVVGAGLWADRVLPVFTACPTPSGDCCRWAQADMLSFSREAKTVVLWERLKRLTLIEKS